MQQFDIRSQEVFSKVWFDAHSMISEESDE